MTTRNLLLLIAALFAMNVLGGYIHGSVDLTEDQRYTLSAPVRHELKNMTTPVHIRVYMTAGFLPADFKRFKKSITEELRDFQAVSGKITYQFEDPNEGDKELVQQRGMALTRQGIRPMRVGKDLQGKDVFVFPAMRMEGRDTVYVNLIDNDIPGADMQTVLSNSISLLEYNIANGIQRATSEDHKVVAFLEGHGELPAGQVADLDRSLRAQGYAVGRLPLGQVDIIDPQIDVLVIAKPRKSYQPKEKFLLDQFIMNGGKTIWLIDRLSADLDSMMAHGRYTPWDYPLELEDMLFKYGFRIKPNLIMDMEHTSVRLVDGNAGNAAQTSVYPWYFHPLVRPFSDHPIVKNLDRVSLQFASVIDTIRTKKAYAKRDVLLRTSDKTMLKYSPIDLNFEFLREAPLPDLFNEKNLPVAVMAEGRFVSAYEYQATEAMKALLRKANQEQRAISIPTKMLVVSDGDIAKNDFDPNTGNIRGLGFDRVSGNTYANKTFLMNAIEYMLDDGGLISAKNREVKLNLLDCTRAKEEKSWWQWFNIGLPLIGLTLFGLGYRYWRRWKYRR